jgi:hypothetical protein
MQGQRRTAPNTKASGPAPRPTAGGPAPEIRRPNRRSVVYADHCANCLTGVTSQWRKGRRGETFCQPCGRSERRHDNHAMYAARRAALETVLLHMLETSRVPRPV